MGLHGIAQKKNKMVEWKQITDFNYMISDHGSLKNLKGNIKNIESGNKVRLYKNNIRYKKSVDRLVFETFNKKLQPKDVIRHIDGDLENNFINNLEIVCDLHWFALKDYPMYEISEEGIRNAKTLRILKPGGRYPAVSVSQPNNSKIKRLILHRAIAMAFIPNVDNLPFVNHIDGNKNNHKIINLEWVSSSENQKHAFKTGLNTVSKKGIKIEEVDKFGNIINIFDSKKDVYTMLGLTNQTFERRLKSNTPINGRYFRKHIYKDLKDEIWLYLNTSDQELNKRFKISNYGRVKNLSNHILNSHANSLGYTSMNLYYNSKGINKMIHRLVAFAFYKSDKYENQVDHIDKNPKNNHLSNLQIIDRKSHMLKDLGKSIRGINMKTGKIIEFKAVKLAAEYLNVTSSNIGKAAKLGKNSNGYKWIYI